MDLDYKRGSEKIAVGAGRLFRHLRVAYQKTTQLAGRYLERIAGSAIFTHIFTEVRIERPRGMMEANDWGKATDSGWGC